MLRPVFGLAFIMSAVGLAVAVAAVDAPRDVGRSERAAKANRLPVLERIAAAPDVSRLTSVLEGQVFSVRDHRGVDMLRIDRARGVTTLAKGFSQDVAAPGATEPVVRGDACGSEGPCAPENDV